MERVIRWKWPTYVWSFGLSASWEVHPDVIRAAVQSSEELKTLCERQEAMSRVQGHLVTIVGCLLSLASFCFLPFMVIPFTPFTFTGLQLVTLGSPILLPPAPQVDSTPSGLWVLNVPFIWVPPFLVVLLGFAAVGDLLLTRQGESARKAITRGILIVASLTFCFSLCSFGLSLVAGFAPMGHQAEEFIRGSLFTPGFLGFLVGLVVALIGGMITLRSKRAQKKGY